MIDRETEDSDDAVRVARARGGDIDAFAALVERHRAAVRRVAARIVGVQEADDVVQDTFLRAFHRLARFRGDAPFRAWLMRIAHHAALDALDRRQARPLVDAVAATATGRPDGGAVKTPADELEDEEMRERLREKLQLLTPSHRAVLVLSDLEGLSYGEIAAATEAPLGSVKGRLHRARHELISILQANSYDWELPDE